MEQNVDVVDLVSSLLDSGKYKEALAVPVEEKYATCFKDNCWDLISVVTSKIQDDTMIIKPSLYGTCEELLSLIVQKATPEEALLEFIEQIEVAKNDAQFGILLEPLQQLLLKLLAKKGRSLEWCLNSISTYVENIPIPEHQLEEKERLLLDSDNNIRRIIKIYSLLSPFLNPIVNEVAMLDANQRTKEILAAFLISLLGTPLIHIDLDPDSNANSEARSSANTILQNICLLVRNIFKFLNYVELSFKEAGKQKSAKFFTEEELSPYEHKEKINMTTLSGLYYVMLSGHFSVPDFAIPVVYSSIYVADTTLLCVVHLLSFVQYGPLAKGIALCKKILSTYPNDNNHTVLSNSVHYSLCKNLVNISVYSNYDYIRKEAVKLIAIHINKFDYKGRCMLIKFILDTANHSGIIGFAITLLKNSIDKAFQESELPECFTGVQLIRIVKKVCYLPHGAESDLVELADQIITALNFLRYLALKDTLNKTGIRGHFDIIEEDYLKNLRTGLNMSKAHYEVKLRDIENAKRSPREQVEVSINVGGNVLDKIPVENKKQIIHSALNAFHLIEGLVACLSECIAVNKSSNL